MSVQWSTTDLSTTITISGSAENVATQGTGGANALGRANAASVGKLYYEAECTAYGGATAGGTVEHSI